MRRMALLGLMDAVGIEPIAGLTDEETEWLTRTSQIDRTQLPLVMRTNLPPWLFDKLVERYGEEQTLALADAMNQQAPLDLRVNALTADRDAVIAELAQGADSVRANAFMRRWVCG